MSKWGIYAEIEGNKCEGMIPIGSLQGDYYMLDEDNYQVIGRRYGKCYKLGDPVTIRVKGVNMAKKLIDFELVDLTHETPTTKERNGSHRRKSADGTSKSARKSSGSKTKAKESGNKGRTKHSTSTNKRHKNN